MKLSVIVPVYNVETYVLECLESIYNQGLDESDFEIIVVDDGSTDGSINIVEKFLSVHSNISIIVQENKGLSAARNTGIRKAAGDYLLFVDSDDFLFPGCLAGMLNKAVAEQVEVLRAEYKMVDEEGKSIVAWEEKITGEGESEIIDGITLYEKVYIRGCYAWVYLFSRSFWYKTGLAFKEGIYYEDMELIPRLMGQVCKAIYVPVLFYAYRQRQTSICSTLNEKKLMDLASGIAELNVYGNQPGLDRRYKSLLRNQVSLTMAYLISCLVRRGVYQKRRGTVRKIKSLKLGCLPYIGKKKDRYRIFVYNLLGMGVVVLEYNIRRLLRKQL